MLCTIERTFQRDTLDSEAFLRGEHKVTSSEVLTEPCGSPLFGTVERQTGCCSICASGWETEANTFTDAGRAAANEAVRRAFKCDREHKLLSALRNIKRLSNEGTAKAGIDQLISSIQKGSL